MRTSIYRALATIAITVLAMPSTGQTSTRQVSTSQATTLCKVDPAAHRRYTAFTAEFKITNVQTLADGTTITRESTEVVALDSQGRHMTSTTNVQGVNGSEPITHVNVNDPVANTQMNWNSRTKKATGYKLPAPEQRNGCWSTDSGDFRSEWNTAPPRGNVVQIGATARGVPPATVPVEMLRQSPPPREDLGTAMIQGLEAHGYRTTRTIPIGEVGNDEPIVTTQEYWVAPGFERPVREISDDPRSGKRTRELANLTLSEPDLTTFQPPEGYEVVTEELHQVPCPHSTAMPPQ
jgi:hypothetical protein